MSTTTTGVSMRISPSAVDAIRFIRPYDLPVTTSIVSLRTVTSITLGLERMISEMGLGKRRICE